MKSCLVGFLGVLCFVACRAPSSLAQSDAMEIPAIIEIRSAPIRELLVSSEEQINLTRNYSQSYFTIPYPNGDLPISTGACTDVVIRAFRRAGVDLQKEVHEDMVANFRGIP